jgi:hypothetical protein
VETGLLGAASPLKQPVRAHAIYERKAFGVYRHGIGPEDLLIVGVSAFPANDCINLL